MTLKPAEDLRKLWRICVYIGAFFTAVPVCLVSLVVWLELSRPGQEELPLASILVPAIGAAFLFLVSALLTVWIGAYHASLEYVIDDDAVKAKRGVFWQESVAVPYSKITNIDVTQGPLQRRYGLSTVHVQTAGAGGPSAARAELCLHGLKNADEVKEAILAKVKAAG